MKMARTFWPKSGGLGEQAKIILPVTFGSVAGGGDLVKGQVVALADDGKWYKLVREITVTGEALKGYYATGNAGNRVVKQGVQIDAGHLKESTPHINFANARIIPGTVEVKLNNGGTVDDAVDDPHTGRLLKKADKTKVYGDMEYLLGRGVLTYPSTTPATNGNVSADYRHGDPDGKSVPAGILIQDKLALSATANVTGSVLVFGEWALAPVWPAANLAADEKTRMKALLLAAGIFLR